MATKTAAAKKQPEETKNLPTAPINFEADSGKGMEGADRDAYAIPFLLTLQPMSPAVVENKPGAAPGIMMNSVTSDLYGTEAFLVPCAYQRRWIRWAPRDLGGGFKGEFTTAEVAAMRASGAVKDLDGRLYYPADDGSVNEKKCDRLADTRSHYVLVFRKLNDSLGIPMVLALASTGIKTSKLFNSRIDSVRFTGANGNQYVPPSFANIYRVKTSLQKNTKGSWYSMDINLVQAIDQQNLYLQAKAFHDNVMKGSIEVAHSTMNAQSGEGGSEEDADGKF